MNLDDPIDVAVALSWALLIPGVLLAIFRLLRGPTTADRVVALDLVGYLAVGMCALRALEQHEEYPLHPGLVLALLAFLGTVVFARFIERRAVR